MHKFYYLTCLLQAPTLIEILIKTDLSLKLQDGIFCVNL